MRIKKGQLVELEVDGIAFGGKGVAHIDKLVVFVDGAVPGDRVMAQIYKKKRRFLEARTREILTASKDRVKAPCHYVGWCGGCKWQFLSYAKQLEYKQQHVAESLAHIGGLEAVSVHPTIPSKKIFGYRNKMEFSCSDRRWLLPSEMEDDDLQTDFALGLHVPGTFYKVLDIEACLLQPALGNELLDFIRQKMLSSGLPAYGLRSHLGFWRFLMLRHSKTHNQWLVNLITSGSNDTVLQLLAQEVMVRFPQVVSVVNNVTARKASIAVGESENCLAGAATISEKIGDRMFEISANSFFQTNTRGAATLYDVVERYADLDGTQQLLDLYCGTGSISLCLADKAKTVVGFEWVESAVADAHRNVKLNGVSNCRFVAGDVRRMLSEFEDGVDVMVIDPPRVGMHQDVVTEVMCKGPQKIVYVSCNPSTLARDLALLKEAYHVAEVQPVDMFPHTWHIEAVAKLVKK